MRKLVIIGAAVAALAASGAAYALADTSSGPLGVTATCASAPGSDSYQVTFTTGSYNTWGIVATLYRGGQLVGSSAVPITIASRLDHNQSSEQVELVTAVPDRALIAFVGPDGFPHVFAVKCTS